MLSILRIRKVFDVRITYERSLSRLSYEASTKALVI